MKPGFTICLEVTLINRLEHSPIRSVCYATVHYGERLMRVHALACLMSFLAVPALANPDTEVSVVSGNWMSVRSTDETGSRICIGASLPVLGFRASPQGLEIRVTNDAWSMSADVNGDVLFKVGDVTKTISMSPVSGSTLTGLVQSADLAALLDAMDKAPVMRISVGKAKPIAVSLSGSTRAMNDFRTCSSVRGYGDLGGKAVAGGNPFQ